MERHPDSVKHPLRLVVCGGRKWMMTAEAFSTLDRIHRIRGISTIIQGGASGTDELARCWAAENSVPVETFEADWEKHGRAAGPIRNEKMLDEAKPDAVLAFPGGDGTENCVATAREKRIRVWQVHKWET